MKPTVLVATTDRWFPTARLVLALADAGFRVDAVCPSGHPLAKTRVVRKIYSYRGLQPVASLAAAIAGSRPDLIIPGDDLATQQLHRLHQQVAGGGRGAGLAALIERSLGPSQSFPIVFARTAFMDLAREEGVRAPKTQVIEGVEDLRKWTARVGFPIVLKADRTSGGDGVRIVHTLQDAECAFAALAAPPLLARAVKRTLLDRDSTLLWPSVRRMRSVVNGQTFAPGREATSAAACWRGSLLASLHFEVIGKAKAAGHATVLRVVENAEMSGAVETMVRRLGLSGFHGFDFMLEPETGRAHLIEINPRTTQAGHLTLGPGRDLPAALYAAVSGEPLKPAPPVTENDTIALFPQEWIRDPYSPFLQSGYHDVPWQEPDLVFAGVVSRRKQSVWYARKSEPQAAIGNPFAVDREISEPVVRER